MPLQTLILPRGLSALKTLLCLGRVQTATRSRNNTPPFPSEEVTMLSDGPKRLKKTWEELTATASMETDPEKLATIMEEIFAALEERERTLSLSQDPSGFRERPTET
jgi:hypothetical protein